MLFSFGLDSVFLASTDLENIITLVFSGVSLILHLAHHIAKFRRFCCKNFAAKRTFAKSDRASEREDFHPRVTVDQAEGLCHRITLDFGRLNIETGALYYCILIRLKYWTVVCFVKVW